MSMRAGGACSAACEQRPDRRLELGVQVLQLGPGHAGLEGAAAPRHRDGRRSRSCSAISRCSATVRSSTGAKAAKSLSARALIQTAWPSVRRSASFLDEPRRDAAERGDRGLPRRRARACGVSRPASPRARSRAASMARQHGVAGGDPARDVDQRRQSACRAPRPPPGGIMVRESQTSRFTAHKMSLTLATSASNAA